MAPKGGIARAKSAVSEKYDPAMEVGFGDLIATFNCSSRTVQIMVDGGYITKNKRGLYKLCDAVQGAMRYKSDHGVKKGSTKEASAQRVQEARARQIEQATAIEAKQLMSFDEHVAIVNLLVGGLSVELDGLPAQLTRDRDLRALYEKTIHAMKTRLMDRWEKMASDVEAEAALGEDDGTDGVEETEE